MSHVITVSKDGKRWKVALDWIKRGDYSTAAHANKEAKRIRDREHPTAKLFLAKENDNECA